jgi:NADPH:quinone reductase-like Zn-dependent oxidoreductase
MKAAIFEKPGLENLKVIDNAEEPKISDHDILIKVKVAGINPIDNFVVSGGLPKIDPLPHIPGAESSGIVEQVGSHVNNNNSNIRKGDRVVVHNKVFDGQGSIASLSAYNCIQKLKGGKSPPIKADWKSSKSSDVYSLGSKPVKND